MSDWPSEDPAAPGEPVGPEDETVVQPTGPGAPPPPLPPGGPPPGPPPPGGPPPDVAERELWPWLLALLLLVIAGILLAYFLTRGGGHKTHRVPSVLRDPQAVAIRRVHRAGFRVTVKNAFSRQPRGKVFIQKPAPGSRLVKGATVALTVSRGVKLVAVPNLMGLPQSQAVSQLTRAGLNSKVVLVANAAPANRVVSQSPAAATKVKPGSTVRLNVSKGRVHTTTVTKTVTNTRTRTQVTTMTTPTSTITTTRTTTSTTTTP